MEEADLLASKLAIVDRRRVAAEDSRGADSGAVAADGALLAAFARACTMLETRAFRLYPAQV